VGRDPLLSGAMAGALGVEACASRCETSTEASRGLTHD